MAQNVFRTIRVRSGMYITPDAGLRIVRRANPFTRSNKWIVQTWNAEVGIYEDTRRFPTLAAARKHAASITKTAF